MKEESIVDNYEPFGDEWKKEVSKLPKAFVIEQWKQSCLKRQELEAGRSKSIESEKAKDERIKELEAWVQSNAEKYMGLKADYDMLNEKYQSLLNK